MLLRRFGRKTPKTRLRFARGSRRSESFARARRSSAPRAPGLPFRAPAMGCCTSSEAGAQAKPAARRALGHSGSKLRQASTGNISSNCSQGHPLEKTTSWTPSARAFRGGEESPRQVHGRELRDEDHQRQLRRRDGAPRTPPDVRSRRPKGARRATDRRIDQLRARRDPHGTGPPRLLARSSHADAVSRSSARLVRPPPVPRSRLRARRGRRKEPEARR